jgi:hypothetical protein
MNLNELRAIPVDRAHAVGLGAVSASVVPKEPMAKKIAIGMLGFAVPLMFGMWIIADKGQAPQAQNAPSQAVTTSDGQLHGHGWLVEREVRKQLRDPESAQFSDMRSTALTNGQLAVCGLVNSKNGFGGYGGNEIYAAFVEGNEVREVYLDEVTPGFVWATCKKLGLAQ